jgi:hypothetical protein
MKQYEGEHISARIERGEICRRLGPSPIQRLTFSY